MSPGPDDGPSLILDEEVPAGHRLVQPASASPGMPGHSTMADVPMAEPPRLSELGGGSLQPLGGESPPSRGNTQPHRNETAPSRRQTIKTTVKPPPKPRPDKTLRFSLDPYDKPPKNAKDNEMPEEVDEMPEEDNEMPEEDDRMPHKRPRP